MPSYLKQYCIEQDYGSYTSLEQATWRYIMRQNLHYFIDNAIKIYPEGLKKTGVTIESIPRIEEMDAKLQKMSWGAVPVCGFIPPAAFLEFQARGLLAIACEMRSLENLEYTPAPDIVHEAAGHAPIIAHPEYAAYLKQYAQMAKKAIFSEEDIGLYETIRYLSDIKEKPGVPEAEIQKAEEAFQKAHKSMSYVSEAAKVSRMAWWTVEYGLLEENSKKRIYGAGLLSSMEEGQNSLSDAVKKVPLTMDCVNQSFDITKIQPQLFVARNIHHLVEVLEDLEKKLSYKRGSLYGLKEALRSKTVNTVVLDSGLAISAVLDSFQMKEGQEKEINFIKFLGPAQLSYEGEELLDHGRHRHPEGFSSPLGQKVNEGNSFNANTRDRELDKLGIKKDCHCSLRFESGFTVEGVVLKWLRKADKLLCITWTNCKVEKDGKEYFNPSWGEFDMAIGQEVTSVHGGPGDRQNYGEYNVGQASSAPGRDRPYTDKEVDLFAIYEEIRQLRESEHKNIEKDLETISKRILDKHPKQWLASVEIVELVKQKLQKEMDAYPWLQDIDKNILSNKETFSINENKLIQKGLHIAHKEIKN